MIVSTASRASLLARRHRNALINAHVAAALFGLTGILGALINADATLITGGRALFAALALLAITPLQAHGLLYRMSWRKARLMLLCGVMLLAHWVTFFVAVQVGGVAVATLGFASFPAFIALLDLLMFRERLGLADGLQLALVSLGLVLVVPALDLADQGTLGLLWGLGSGFSFALLSVTNRRYAKGMPALQVAFWQNLVVALAIAPFALRAEWANPLPGQALVYLAVLGILCTGLSQYLFVKSLEALPARSTGMIIALEPVYAIACAWWLFQEQPSLRMWLGATLVILASVSTSWLTSGSKPAKRCN